MLNNLVVCFLVSDNEFLLRIQLALPAHGPWFNSGEPHVTRHIPSKASMFVHGSTIRMEVGTILSVCTYLYQKQGSATMTLREIGTSHSQKQASPSKALGDRDLFLQSIRG